MQSHGYPSGMVSAGHPNQSPIRGFPLRWDYNLYENAGPAPPPAHGQPGAAVLHFHTSLCPGGHDRWYEGPMRESLGFTALKLPGYQEAADAFRQALATRLKGNGSWRKNDPCIMKAHRRVLHRLLPGLALGLLLVSAPVVAGEKPQVRPRLSGTFLQLTKVHSTVQPPRIHDTIGGTGSR
jgi:hypothetical protein